jgi:hypothetical protein
MNELEKIDNEIRKLRLRALQIREHTKPQYLELNDIPLVEFRANRLKITTVKKEVKNSTKQLKSKTMAKIKVSINKEELSKLMVASGFASCEVVSSEVTNPKKLGVVIGYSRGEDLLEIGGYMQTLTDADVKAEIERRKKLADEKAAKEKAAAKK